LSILGREIEVARLDAELESLPSKSVRLVLEGEAGIGKTTLLLAGLAAAEGRGYRVLASRPAEADRALPWTGVSDLLGTVPASALAELPEPQREALEVALLRRATRDRAPDPRAVFTAFATVVSAISAETPVVVAVDDLQWLDPPSARALEFLGRRALRVAVAVVASARVTGDAVASPTARWFAPEERLRLAPLSAAALHQLIQERLGVNLPRTSVIRLHRLCAGNAFHALEIAQRLTAAALSDAHADWPLPPDVRDLVASHVRGLDDTARQELVLAAAAAQPTEALVGPKTLDAAEAAGLIRRESGRVQFVHPLYVEAVYASASVEQRRQAHAQLARRESDRAERARHLGLTIDVPDAGVAAELEAGAADARSRGAYETAGELLERAIELTPVDAREDRERRLLAAATDWIGAATPRARELLLELLGRPLERRVRAQALRLFALVHFREESVPQAIALLEEAAVTAGDDDDLRALCELELAFFSVNVSFDFDAARPHADRALACAERVGDAGILAQALAVKAIADFLLGDGLDEARIEQALELEPACGPDVPSELRPSLIAGSLALYQGLLARALRLLGALAVQVREQGVAAELPLLLCVMAWASAWAGDPEAATTAVTEALELAAATGSASLVGYSRSNAAFAAAHAGKEAECRAHVEAALADMERAGYAVHAIWSLSALGLLELSRGDAPAAAATLQPLVAAFEESPPYEPIRAFFLPDAIEALATTGESERATRLNELYGQRANALGRGWAIAAAHRCSALIAAGRRDLDGARTSVEHAVVLQRQQERPLELARSLLLLGQIERRAKRKAAARAALEEADAICNRIGAGLWNIRVREELARLGGAAKPDALSATEERVARLAAAGLTNREIASAAFMSEKTVEANLSRVYRKLGLRSRTELARRFAVSGDPRIPTG
jgi:DNA-binding CsgD family transcriptional regulator